MTQTPPVNDEQETKVPMLRLKEINIPGYEKVVEGIDEESNLHCLIAIHDTTLGPALGGVRVFPYRDDQEALKDVLRLAKGMTKKSAIVEVGLGGGKSVIIADPRTEKNTKLLHSFGAVVDTLKGQYIVAEDVGSSPKDMEVIKEATPYVGGLPNVSSSGDPSPYTAWGVFRGLQATAHRLWGSPFLKGRKVAVQGLGHVGSKVAKHLFWAGADLVLADIDKVKLENLAYHLGAETVSTEEIFSVECDILCPCAMGGIINAETVDTLRCKAVAGSANNQLLHDEDGSLLYSKGILYAPDYIINSGGLINCSIEYEPGGYNPKIARSKVDNLYKILLNIFNTSERKNKSTCEVAEELWGYNMKHCIGKRQAPIVFNRH